MRNWIDGDYIDDDDFDECESCSDKIEDKSAALLAYTTTGDILCARCLAQSVEAEDYKRGS